MFEVYVYMKLQNLALDLLILITSFLVLIVIWLLLLVTNLVYWQLKYIFFLNNWNIQILVKESFFLVCFVVCASASWFTAWSHFLSLNILWISLQHDFAVRSAKFIARKQWNVAGADDRFIHVYNYITKDRVKRVWGTKI